jgi:deoxyribodipyrimidine photolyase
LEAGHEHPTPIIDHNEARDRALEALASIRKR